MPKVRLLVLLIVSVWLLSAQAPILAQSPESSDDPLFFLYRDTIWRWSPAGGAQRVGKPFSNLVNLWLAPDGTHILVKTLSQHVKTLIDQDCPCGGTIPDGREFWLLAISTGERTRITPDYENYTTLRQVPILSDPLWSPDGARIAWAQGVEASDLMIYDLATGQVTTTQTGIQSPDRVSNVAVPYRWSPAGIWFKQAVFSEDLNDLPGGYTIYHPSGGIAAEIPPYTEFAGLPEVSMFDGTPAYAVFNHFSVDLNGTDTFITHSLTGWQSLNLASGASQPLTTGSMMQVAAAAQTTSLRISAVSFSNDADTMDLEAYHREIYTSTGTRLTDISNGFPLLTLYGSAILLRRDANLIRLLFADGSTRVFELPWEPDRTMTTPTRYLLATDTDHLLIGAHCENSDLPFRFSMLPAELESDPVGHVLGGDPNNLRETPGRDGTIIGELKGGASFEVKAGPVCIAGIAWWQVEGMNGQTGWTAEGVDGEYFIAPGCSVDYCNAEG